MQAGYKLQDGGRIDVSTDKGARRVRLELIDELNSASGQFTLTLSEARAVASALMGCAAEA